MTFTVKYGVGAISYSTNLLFAGLPWFLSTFLETISADHASTRHCFQSVEMRTKKPLALTQILAKIRTDGADRCTAHPDGATILQWDFTVQGQAKQGIHL
ncbi:hypothetical protein PoB_001004100 [Plakobranchus ocellatus]|uniref:Uncharacterized protein n=1 Tax=Plakobranchus ocellatus TaxID=259542 RepID=A0AAV3YJV9_9GAST|nr:hypothetical protein PoB_001004100 [Plakobranchus ocellatus]